MFEVLVESGWKGGAGFGPRVTSFLVHGGLVALAALGVSRSSSGPVSRPVAQPIPFYVETTEPMVSQGGGGRGVPGTIVGQSPMAPFDPPTTIPPVGAPLASTRVGPSPQELAGRELFGPGSGMATVDPSQVLLAAEVDEPVSVRVPALPVYPAQLAAAGIGGEVRLEFVVDTAGHCEPGTVRVLKSSEGAFESAAKSAVCETVYRPGKVRGQAVRQLVQQKVAFRQQ